MLTHLQWHHIYNDVTFTMMSHLQWRHIYNDVTFTMMFWLPSTITSLKFLNDIDNSTPGGLLVGWISATQKYTTVHQCCSYMYTLNVTCIDTLQHMAFPLGCRVYQQIFGGVKSLSRYPGSYAHWLARYSHPMLGCWTLTFCWVEASVYKSPVWTIALFGCLDLVCDLCFRLDLYRQEFITGLRFSFVQ